MNSNKTNNSPKDEFALVGGTPAQTGSQLRRVKLAGLSHTACGRHSSSDRQSNKASYVGRTISHRLFSLSSLWHEPTSSNTLTGKASIPHWEVTIWNPSWRPAILIKVPPEEYVKTGYILITSHSSFTITDSNLAVPLNFPSCKLNFLQVSIPSGLIKYLSREQSLGC